MYRVLVLLVIVVQITGTQLSYRLTKDILPIHYSLKFHPHLENDTFNGEVTITVHSSSIVDAITLHSFELNITKSTVNYFPVLVEDKAFERISLKFIDGRPFSPGEHVIRLNFHGKISEDFGLKKAAYQFHDKKGFLVASEFEPTYARRAFPCFDEPSFKAAFNIRLVSPNDSYTAVSNMPEIARYPTSTGIIYDFATSVKMSTYLISVAIADYTYYEEIIELNNKSLPVRVYTYNASKEANQNAIKAARIALNFYTNYTGIEYPLPKLDMIEYDKGKIAATETWGLIQLKQGLLTPTLDIYDELQCHTVIYHELGHFWFGNLVTNDFWNDLWLQESFASFLADKTFNVDTSGFLDFHMSKLVEMSIGEPKELVNELKTTDYIEKRFDRIVYEKGNFFLRILEDLVGKQSFQNAIKTFLTRNSFSTATSNDMISAFENEVPKTNIRSFMESYLYQPYYPVLYMDDTSGKYVIRQIQNIDYKWTIPISYVHYDGDYTGSIWFDRDQDSVELQKPNNSAIIIKPGLYVVSYSENIWNEYIQKLNYVPDEQFYMLLDSVFSLYRLKYINCDKLFALFSRIEDSSYSLTILVKIIYSDVGCFEKEYKLFLEYIREVSPQIADEFSSPPAKSCHGNTSEPSKWVRECGEWIKGKLKRINELK